MSSEELVEFLFRYEINTDGLCRKCHLVNTFVDDCNEWCHYIDVRKTYAKWLEMDYEKMVNTYWGK